MRPVRIPFFALLALLIFLSVGAWFNPASAARFGETLCEDAQNFACIVIRGEVIEREVRRKGQTRIVQKTVVDAWEDIWPDERQREMVMKVNRFNGRLRDNMIVAVPRGISRKNLMDFSPFARSIPPPGEKLLIFDPSVLAFAAYDADGTLLRWGPAVGGRSGHRTPAGTFRIYRKHGAGYRSGKYPIGCQGRSCARMPYAMFFKAGYAFHAGYLPGVHASQGCVRVFYQDAKWLNQIFAERGAKVVIRPYSTKR